MADVKKTRKEKDDLLNRLLIEQTELQAKSDEVKYYLNFQKLPYAEKTRIYQQWDAYYKKVQGEGVGKQIFMEAKKAFENKDMARVKELAEQAKKMRENGEYLKTPTFMDPEDFYQNTLVQRYVGVTRKIEELRGESDGTPVGIFYDN